MRKAVLDRIIHSDVDLTQLSTRRVTIVKVEEGVFRVTSSLRFWSCERASFVGRYLQRKRPGMTYFTGNCSSPTGYYWGALVIGQA